MEALQQFGVAQHGLIVEGELRGRGLSQRDVRKFVGQHQRQAGFVRQNVNQAAADDDGVADRKGFERRGQQHAAVRFDVEFRRDDQVVDHRVEHVVHGPGRRQQTAFFQARQDVVFGLALPRTLAFERRKVLGRGVVL